LTRVFERSTESVCAPACRLDVKRRDLIFVQPSPCTDDREWYTGDEVARRFGLSKQAVFNAADDGRLPCEWVEHGLQTERRFSKSLIDPLPGDGLPRTVSYPPRPPRRETLADAPPPRKGGLSGNVGRPSASSPADATLGPEAVGTLMAEIVQLKDALAVAMAAEDAGNDQAFAAERMLRDAADLVKASNDRAAMWKTIAREILVKP